MNARDAICAADLPGASDWLPEYYCEDCGAVLRYPATPQLCGDCEEKRFEAGELSDE